MFTNIEKVTFKLERLRGKTPNNILMMTVGEIRNIYVSLKVEYFYFS